MYVKGTRVLKSSVDLSRVDFNRALDLVSTALIRNPEYAPFGIEKLEAAVADLGLQDVFERILAEEEEIRRQERKDKLATVGADEPLPKWATGAKPFLGRDAAFRKNVVCLTLCVASSEGEGSWGSPDGIGTEFVIRVLGDRVWESLN